MSFTTKPFYVIFATTRSFLEALEEVRTEGLKHSVRSTPHDLAEQCGMCLYFEAEMREKVEALLPENRKDLLYLDVDKV